MGALCCTLCCRSYPPQRVSRCLQQLDSMESFPFEILELIESFLHEAEQIAPYKQFDPKYKYSHLIDIYEAGRHKRHVHVRLPCKIIILDPFPKALFLYGYEAVEWRLVGMTWSVQAVYLMGYYQHKLIDTGDICCCFLKKKQRKVFTHTYYPRNGSDCTALRLRQYPKNMRLAYGLRDKKYCDLCKMEGASGQSPKQNAKKIEKFTGFKVVTAQSAYRSGCFSICRICWLVYIIIAVALIVAVSMLV